MDPRELLAVTLIAYGVIGITAWIRARRRAARVAQIYRRILGY